ncbi:MAG: RNase adapter RapZ [Lachnospiraceae bacterium]|nr:RNase adapter RapZ [Lachnospiraceae bacterium]
MKFVILTGMSGAGKSTALKMMEDIGYYCVDNLPIPLIERFAELAFDPTSEMNKVALGLDIRNAKNMGEAHEVICRLRENNMPCEILYLDADDQTLIKRYKETRRNHPLAVGERVENGIYSEREKLAEIKRDANYIIDTSRLLTRELKGELEKIFLNNQDFNNLFVSILSFGFKYGIPTDSDLVFDVRFLPNPYYVEDLKYKNGNDKEIQDFVMQFPQAEEFLNKLEDMINYLIPYYIDEGKNQLVISIGCTGGKHRSVTLANELYKRLSGKKGYGLRIEHRDIPKDALRK